MPESRTMQMLAGDPPFRHLAAIPDESDIRYDVEAQTKHRALSRTPATPANGAATKPERRWLMPTGRNSPPCITLNQARELFLNRGLMLLLKQGKDIPLFVGVALEGNDTIVIERCDAKAPYARRVAGTGAITGGTVRFELEAAGWEPEKYPAAVNAEHGEAVVRRVH